MLDFSEGTQPCGEKMLKATTNSSTGYENASTIDKRIKQL